MPGCIPSGTTGRLLLPLLACLRSVYASNLGIGNTYVISIIARKQRQKIIINIKRILFPRDKRKHVARPLFERIVTYRSTSSAKGAEILFTKFFRILLYNWTTTLSNNWTHDEIYTDDAVLQTLRSPQIVAHEYLHLLFS